MDPFLLVYFALGLVVGVAAGFFGIGGGVIAIPVLMWIFASRGIGGDFYVHLAFGTNLFVIIVTASMASYRHTRFGNVFWKAVPYLAAFSILGAFLSSFVARLIPGDVLRILFAMLMVYSGVRLLMPRKGSAAEDPSETQFCDDPPKGLCAVTGLLAGIVAGLTGLGGGIVAIPLMITLLRFPVRVVAGTSSSIMIFTAIAGTVGYIINGWGNPQLPHGALGFVYLKAAVPYLLGTAISAQIGAKLNSITSGPALRIIFGVFLLLMAIKVLFF
ncbi:MAG TPA: sulfite exporter TauE/SafE family protein [Bacteroidetes bacterium]|nr:sulfite exporter TauE/SafE family protein [Bacteroidota bacterium]